MVNVLLSECVGRMMEALLYLLADLQPTALQTIRSSCRIGTFWTRSYLTWSGARA
jgi:hypothetical protein